MEHRLLRDCRATRIPAGDDVTLAAGVSVHLTQALGGNLTVRAGDGLFRIAAADADALENYTPDTESESGAQEFSEDAVWEALKGCFDPEIPVNIVDLGLIYDLVIESTETGGHTVQVKMTLTAPGCGMGPVIADDAKQRVAALPTVEDVKVHIVWDPQWAPQMISEAGRKQLGIE
jgi:probable FeS assembly SUF system protein SufT